MYVLWPGVTRPRVLICMSVALLGASILTSYGCGSSGNSSGGLPNGSVTMDQVARGRAIITSVGCIDCHSHGKDDPSDPMWLAGYNSANPNDPGKFNIAGFNVYAANLTPDAATGIGSRTDRQIFNALRYGLDPSDTPDVVITSTTPGVGNFPASPTYLPPPMPWPSIRNMSDSDLWAIVAYLKHGIKPVTNAIAASGEGPGGSWAPFYTPAAIGVSPVPAYPESNEQFSP
jgi:hypothetical protein